MPEQDRHIAQMNFGVLRYDWDDPRIAEFADNLARVNAIAEHSEGFIWRLDDEAMEKAQLDPNGVFGGNPRVASTLSVWSNLESLRHFVWHTLHKRFFDKRRDWFAEDGNSNLVLWWVEAGHRPCMDEAMDRFRHLQRHGDTDRAFCWPAKPERAIGKMPPSKAIA